MIRPFSYIQKVRRHFNHAIYVVFWNCECIIFTSMMSMMGMALNPMESQIAQETGGGSEGEGADTAERG